MTPVVVALGSNLGDRLANVVIATRQLAGHIKVLKVSPTYETKPMYLVDQPMFLNAALIAETDLPPRSLLALLKATELEIGRLERTVNGPREIDLDLIAYGSASYRFEEAGRVALVIPHPKTAERRFVLRPLADIAPDFNLPGLGRVKDLLAATEADADSVYLYDDAPLSLSGS